MINWNSPILENATPDQKWEFLRTHRNRLLTQSDWTQLPDAPLDKAAWATYRQELRDLPAQGGNAEDAVIPTQPGAN
jgi:hypothetical protein